MPKTTKIQQAVAAVEHAEKALQDLQAQRQRCTEATAAGADYTGQIAELKRQREEATGAAFLAGTVADTSAFDKQIAALEKKTDEARKTAAAAEVAAGLLLPKIEAAEAEAATARDALKTAIADEMQAAFDAGESAYHAAASALKTALATMAAAERMRDKARGGRPSGLTSGILDSLNAGYHAISPGLVVKLTSGPRAGQYGVDSDISRGLPEQIGAAMDGLKADLAAQGVASDEPAPPALPQFEESPEAAAPAVSTFPRATYRGFTLDADKPIDGNPAVSVATADFGAMSVAEALDAGGKIHEVQQ